MTVTSGIIGVWFVNGILNWFPENVGAAVDMYSGRTQFIVRRNTGKIDRDLEFFSLSPEK
jgi:hypothetical protein